MSPWPALTHLLLKPAAAWPLSALWRLFRSLAEGAPGGKSAPQPLAVELLAKLADLLNYVGARRRATYVAETLAPAMSRYPLAFGHLLGVVDMLVNGAIELAIAGDTDSADFGALARAAPSRPTAFHNRSTPEATCGRSG